MKSLRQSVTVFLLCSLIFLTAGCGVSEEKYNEAVASADDYKAKYELASSDLEKCSKELEELEVNEKLDKYGLYMSLLIE